MARTSECRPLGKADEVVIAQSLQNEEHRGTISVIRDSVRSAWTYDESLAHAKTHLLVRIARGDADFATDHIKGVLNFVVIMPGHFLRWADLQFGDPETRPRRVI
ncbi:hypothetical protein AYJ54_06170 [Bradyrhizobium centrolobii]|uniref:Uncharacterized protein n=1 Tax=Bradyrhizobium centrolobii TaxID=1505087 RepID=A0A176Z055_9BRAD|nr:hypothetical protein AYJ54_06170 [Bradyrhizobium centrolobii]